MQRPDPTADQSSGAKTLVDVLRLVPECVAAAWLDARTAEVRELRRCDTSAEIAFGIEAAASVVCAEDRPPRVVLFSDSHLFVAQRTAPALGPVLLVVFRRSSNIGLSIATIRTLTSELEVP